VLQAQINFCQDDTHAALVSTDDLSDNYHLEAAAMLIIGDRVARALESLNNVGASSRERNDEKSDEKLVRRRQRNLNLYSKATTAATATPSPVPSPTSPFMWQPVLFDDLDGLLLPQLTPNTSPTITPLSFGVWDSTLNLSADPTSYPSSSSVSPSSSSHTSANDNDITKVVHTAPAPSAFSWFGLWEWILNLSADPTSYPSVLPSSNSPSSANDNDSTKLDLTALAPSSSGNNSPIPIITSTPTSAPVICVETSAPSDDPAWQLIFFEDFEHNGAWGPNFLPNNPNTDVALSQLNAFDDGGSWSARLRDSNSFITTRVLDISHSILN